MVLRSFDGFEGYATTGDLGSRWQLISAGLALAPGRFGGQAVRFTSGSGDLARLLGTGAALATVVVGFAFRMVDTGGQNTDLVRLRESGGDQVTLRWNPGGRQFYFTRAGTTILSIPRTVTVGQWYYLELKATIHPTAGAVELRMNGEVWGSGTGLNTRATANAWVDTLWVSSYYTEWYCDDLYVVDGTGAIQNDYLGDCRVQLLRPSGAGDAGDLVLPGSAYASYPAAVLDSAPLHFWQLQETGGLTAADTGTGTQSAATFAARTFAAGPYGGQAADFSTHNVASAPYQADMALTGDVTAEAWCYLNTAAVGANAYFVSRGNTGPATTFGLGCDSSGVPRWAQGNTGYNGGSAALPVGRWFHYAGVRAGTVATFYVDGVAVATTSAMTAPAVSTNPVILGVFHNGAVPVAPGAGPPWPGRIAYVSLYGSALSAAQVRNHRAFAPFAAVDDLAYGALSTDATYAQSGTAGATSLFQLQDPLASTGTVLGVQVLSAAKKDDAGLRVVAPVAKSGATTVAGTNIYLGVDPQVGVQLLPTDPNTGAAWTVAALQALQAGLRVTG